MRHRLLTLAVGAAGLASASQVHSQSAAPARRAHHALGYDPIAGRVLLAGGSTPTNGGRSFQFFNDLWAFDGWGGMAPGPVREPNVENPSSRPGGSIGPRGW